MVEKIRWGEMNRWELEQRAEVVDTTILPIGSLEQHGPHLPLDTDSYDAEHLVEEAVDLPGDSPSGGKIFFHRLE